MPCSWRNTNSLVADTEAGHRVAEAASIAHAVSATLERSASARCTAFLEQVLALAPAFEREVEAELCEDGRRCRAIELDVR
jgi:hypothetical protein